MTCKLAIIVTRFRH